MTPPLEDATGGEVLAVPHYFCPQCFELLPTEKSLVQQGYAGGRCPRCKRTYYVPVQKALAYYLEATQLPREDDG